MRYIQQLQNLPLNSKILYAQDRIREFYDSMDGNVYIAFSGGKDSTVLRHLVNTIYPDIKSVFVNTGLEFPEIIDFVKSLDNTVILRPEASFYEVIKTEGYPVISKEVAKKINALQNPTDKNIAYRNYCLTGIRRDGVYTKFGPVPKKWIKLIDAPFKISCKCCDILKKRPMHKYQKETGTYPFIGTLAADSKLRLKAWTKTVCNTMEGRDKSSRPLSIFVETDIWDYIKLYNLDYSKIYDMGYPRTGCIFCLFGIAFDGSPNRIQLLSKTHPKLYEYCINKLSIGEVMDYLGYDWGPLNE